jgi:hypothetical protein
MAVWQMPTVVTYSLLLLFQSFSEAGAVASVDLFGRWRPEC